jgi:hypothetical protein
VQCNICRVISFKIMEVSMQVYVCICNKWVQDQWRMQNQQDRNCRTFMYISVYRFVKIIELIYFKGKPEISHVHFITKSDKLFIASNFEFLYEHSLLILCRMCIETVLCVYYKWQCGHRTNVWKLFSKKFEPRPNSRSGLLIMDLLWC